MIVEVETWLGKVIFESDKVEGDLKTALPLQRIKLLAAFFPVEWNQIDIIVFEPKNESYDTQSHYDELITYLRNEGFIGGDGNFVIERKKRPLVLV